MRRVAQDDDTGVSCRVSQDGQVELGMTGVAVVQGNSRGQDNQRVFCVG